MTYLKQISDRPRPSVDLQSFARDLAKALGGTSRASNNYPDDEQTIAFNGSHNVLELSAVHREQRVVVRIVAADIPFGDRYHAFDGHKTERATVSVVGRPIERIAADVRKRVIDASQAALSAQREFAKQQANNRAGIIAEVSELRADAPYLSIQHNKGEQQATIYNGGESHYLYATLHHDGTVNVQRLGSMSGEKFRALLKALNA
jgi:hypothetical protein